MFYKINCKSSKIMDLIKNKEVVMFGAGIISEYYVERYNINVKYYVDNNQQKWNTEFLGKKIMNPNFMSNDKGNIVIFIGSQYITEISRQLESLNLKNNIDFFVPQYLEEEAIAEKAGLLEECDKTKKRLLLDMSEVAMEDLGTGIQRVVKNIVSVSYNQKKYETIAIQRLGDSLYEPSSWLDKNYIKENNTGFELNKINMTNNDTLIILDSIWYKYDRYKNIINNVKKMDGRIISVIYDIIPLEYPEKYDRFLVSNFKNMFLDILENANGVIAISKTVADKIIEFINKESINIKKDFKIGWFHIGFSKNNFLKNNEISNNVKKTIENKPFIIVGTIDPRKGHEIALDAFEELWSMQMDVKLCIIGKVAWKAEKLVDRIKSHLEYNKKLFFLEQPSDSELGYCYDKAEALIFPSINEGFGLPIIEAASYNTPLILSDISIFKEIAKENALYFECGSSCNLAKTIKEYIELKQKKLVPKSDNIKINTWEDSFNDMVKIIYEDKWYKKY